MKKNVPLRGSGNAKQLLKFLLLMKLAILLVLFTAYQVEAGVFAQTVTVNVKQTEIKKVLNNIEKKGDVRFLYNYELPELKTKVDFSAENLPVRSALDKLFSNTDLAYKILDNNLIVIHSKSIVEAIPVITITGKITGDNGEILSGVSIMVKGTTKGTTTNNEGYFNLSADKNAVLVVSYIGYESKEISVNGQEVLNIKLNVSSKLLDQVVVVGYGVQKRANVTGAIASVNAKDIAAIPHDGRVEAALEGRTPGVIVGANSGQPGSDFTVRIRGISTISSGNDPLWVVDGVIVQTSNLNYLNQSDIESIEVLKDAASAAIYGTRAANGVILVTTKHGNGGKFTVTYNGYIGTQAPTRLVPMTNATEYATLMNERTLNDGTSTLPFPNPSSLGAGTNWQKQIFNNSTLRTNHEISVRGGGQNANLYVSFAYQDQQGIVLPQVSKYERYSLRINHNENFLKIFKFGQNLAYSRNNSKGIGVNTEFGNAMSDALNLDPLTPVIATATQATAAQYLASPYIVKASNGLPYGISGLVGQEIVNPIAQEQTMMGNNSYSDNIIGNTYLEVDPIKGLAIRTQIGLNRNYWGNWAFAPLYYLNSNTQNTAYNNLTRGSGQGTEWNWDNTISYTKQIKEHTFDVMGGYSMSEDGIGNYTGITYKDLPVTNYQDANFNWPAVASNITAYTYDYTLHRVVSFFGRLNYNYAQKYLLTAIIRYDGSSRFGTNNRWGTFPSVSVGWVPSMEKFWMDNNISNVMDFLKIRASYGVTGNDNFSNFQYAATIGGGNNYVFGANGIPVIGNSPTTLANSDLKWEQTAQTDIGLDARFLKGFNFTFDYFYKKTKGILQQVPIPQYTGVPNEPWANVGDMSNQGIELQLGYNKQLSDWTVGATANFATLKNKITYLGTGSSYLLNGSASFQNMGNVNRDVVGHPAFAFWGYQTNGVFQTQTDVQNYKSANGTVIQPNAQPGDFRWKDVNGDGTISPSDMTYLGSPLPTYTYGLTINAGYGNKKIGNFDFMIFFQGQGGNKIFQGYRRLDVGNANFPADYMNRWTGAGTTNSYPRMTLSDPNENYLYMSNFYLHNGAFMRIKNVQLGYSFPESVAKAIRAEKIRIYIAAENLVTFTTYNGFDPEIGGGVFGIDKGFYPQSRTLIAGLNLQF